MSDTSDDFLTEKNRLKNEYLDKVAKQRRTLNHLKDKLLECSTWQQVEKEGRLLQSNFYKVEKGQKEVTVEDWEDGSQKTLHLEGKTREECLKRYFAKAKRLKRGLESIKQRVEEIEQRLETLQKQHSLIDAAQRPHDLLSFQKKQLTKEDKRKLPYREYCSTTGYRILVGKSQKNNDELSFSIATPHDIWLHTSDFAGAHVIIKHKGRQYPDDHTIEEAALLAIDSSQAKDKPMADVVITRQKYLKRVKGKPGQVMISEKSIKTFITDFEKLSELKKRTNPLP